jgi:carboxypeptidase PM20D1
MGWIGKSFAGLVLAVGALAAVVAGRTMAERPKDAGVSAVAPPGVDRAAAAARLAGAVRIQTISWDDKPDASADAFLALHDYLEKTFPNAHRAMKREKVGAYSLLYTWEGSDKTLKPVMLMAHQDVVPIAPGTEGAWEHPPFSGDIADGFVWGRGAWDDKSNLVSVMEAVETLAASGVQPKRTLIVASGHDEEVGGRRGARAIAELLDKRGVKLEFVIDEGMIVTTGVVPTVARPVAMIGLAEKGYVTLSVTAEGAPGHSSMPAKDSVIGAVAAGIERLQTNQMPARLDGVARQSLEQLAPEMALTNRIVLSNLWLTKPVATSVLAQSPGSNAIMRTTTALTVFNAGAKENVLPGKAQALVNFRIAPGDSVASVLDHARYTVGNPLLKVAVAGEAREPSPVSPSDSAAYGLIERTIRETLPDAVVAPGLVIAGTDSRNMSALTSNIYRFAPVRAKPGDLARFHGTNERISVENYAELIAFFHRLIQVSAVEGK